ncbi:Spt2p [Saccharomyces eubayanus]|uniref:Spt2p n=1 Tax=Saccharomyces eubayanus TaxID=1080349 RepID=UPI0006C2EA84|nr:SPT2-like protein [Saccharomyces eubayanus]KOH00109.1 SPT2-like protein [Saccharomyces eubayanus]
MSFLSKLSQIRKSTTGSTPKVQNVLPKKNDEDYSLLPKNYIRDEDPAVNRLKELRRQELLKNAALVKKSGVKRKRGTSSGPEKKRKERNDEDEGGLGIRFKRSIGSSHAPLKPAVRKKPEPVKKMSFEELMKQAESNEKQPSKTKSPEPVATERPRLNKPGFKSSKKPLKKASPGLASRGTPSRGDSMKLPEQNRPVKLNLPTNGFAQPNRRLKEKLDSRKQRSRYQDDYYEEDNDMDDFIEDDEDEEEAHRSRSKHNDGPGYDRDEIWAMFNRGKKRSEYAYDDLEDDDMEANEMEILEEEEAARKMARLEDKREEAWLKKHEQEKKRRKKDIR